MANKALKSNLTHNAKQLKVDVLTKHRRGTSWAWLIHLSERRTVIVELEWIGV